jgi:ABC-type Fe3+ transport system substrate-binding protein
MNATARGPVVPAAGSDRRWRKVSALLLSAVLALTACTAGQATPAAGGQPDGSAQQKAGATTTPSQAKPAKEDTPTAPTASATGGVPTDWEQRWNQLIAAARQEGKVVVFGPPNPELRQSLPEAFKRAFGLELEYNGIASSDFSARLVNERAAGVHSADAVIGGSDSMFRVMAAEGKVADGAMGMLAPLRPALVLPEVLDPSKYRNGKLWLPDPEEHYVLRLSNYVSISLTVNEEIVPAASITSYEQLLKPEYKGRMAAHDPSVLGAGIGTASFIYARFGEDYARQLYLGQDVFLAREHRQLGDLLVRGSHPIVLALEPQERARLKAEGFKITELANLGGYLTNGNGLTAIVDRAPHPNAARLFLNWVASREGAQVYQDGQQEVSTRADVDVSRLFSENVPKPGVDYLDTATWDYVFNHRIKVQDSIRQILARR